MSRRHRTLTLLERNHFPTHPAPSYPYSGKPSSCSCLRAESWSPTLGSPLSCPPFDPAAIARGWRLLNPGLYPPRLGAPQPPQGPGLFGQEEATGSPCCVLEEGVGLQVPEGPLGPLPASPDPEDSPSRLASWRGPWECPAGKATAGIKRTASEPRGPWSGPYLHLPAGAPESIRQGCFPAFSFWPVERDRE